MNATRFVPCLLAAALFLAAGDSPVIRVPPAADAASVPRMVVTVDDLPVAPGRRHDDAQRAAITEKLLATLTAHRVPAVGFVNEDKLLADGEVVPARVDLLRRWLDAGMELGNHGFAHLDLHEVDEDTWFRDILRGERIIRPRLTERGRPLRWFRHPFLHTGRSPETQVRVLTFLEIHGYAIAPVTVDNSEWLYGGAYADAWNRGDRELMERLGWDYVRYMLEVVGYYEEQSRRIVGRAIPHVLLVHAYALNADWLGEILTALEERGYRWTSLAEALDDPVYDLPSDGYTGGGGITWLHRWAITAGADRSVFAGEPEVPGWVSELAERARRSAE